VSPFRNLAFPSGTGATNYFAEQDSMLFFLYPALCLACRCIALPVDTFKGATFYREVLLFRHSSTNFPKWKNAHGKREIRASSLKRGVS
jgi:hypothetical protein